MIRKIIKYIWFTEYVYKIINWDIIYGNDMGGSAAYDYLVITKVIPWVMPKDNLKYESLVTPWAVQGGVTISRISLTFSLGYSL